MVVQLLKSVSHKEYHDDALPGSPRFSRTCALEILTSPRHAYAWHPKLGGAGRQLVEDGEEDDTGRKENVKAGAVIHELLLKGGLGIAVIEADSFRSNAAKDQKREAIQSGLLPVIRSKYELALKDAERIRKRLAELDIDLTAYEPEVTGLFEEEVSGGPPVACKVRQDLLSLGLAQVLDVKVVDHLNPGAFERSIPAYGLDIQAHIYVRSVELAKPELAGRVSFEFLVCERKPPYDVMVAELAPSFVGLGEMRWKRALKKWRGCLDSGAWPGVGRVAPLLAKEWALRDEMEIGNPGDPAWLKGDA